MRAWRQLDLHCVCHLAGLGGLYACRSRIWLDTLASWTTIYSCSHLTSIGLVANITSWTGGTQENCRCRFTASPPLLCLVVFALCLRPGSVSQGEDVFPIPGTKRIKYLEQKAAAFQIKLATEEKLQLEAVFASDQVWSLMHICLTCLHWLQPVDCQTLANCKLIGTTHENQLFMLYCKITKLLCFFEGWVGRSYSHTGSPLLSKAQHVSLSF